MRKIYFRLSGNRKLKTVENDNVFLQSRNRVPVNSTYFGNNDYVTEIRIPETLFKENFKYEHFSGIYRTKLTYRDLHDYMTIIQ